MGSTEGDALPFPDEGEVVAPLEEWFERFALATQAGLNRRPRVMHREFTTRRFQQPDGAYQYQQLVAHDAAAASSPTFAYDYAGAGSGTAEGSWAVENGLYLISWFGFIGAVSTSRAVAEIATGGDGTAGSVLERVAVPAGDDRISLRSAPIRLVGAQRFWIRSFKTNGGSATVDGRLRITRLGDA